MSGSDPIPSATNGTDGSVNPRQDRFTPLSAVLASSVVGLFFFSAYASNNFEKFGALSFLSLLAGFALTIANLALVIHRLWKRRWRASLSAAVALFVLVGCFLARYEIFFEMDRARFQIYRSQYVDELTTGTNLGAEKGLKIISWGFWGYFISGTFYRKLAYDETDQIGTSDGLNSERVQSAIQATMENKISYCRVYARPIERHFYIVDIACS